MITKQQQSQRAYTLRPDLPIPNEKLISDIPSPGIVQNELILTKDFPPNIWNQGETNSCTAQSICALYYYLNKGIDTSRLFQYYNERLLMNIVSQDVGVSLRDSMNALFTYGICAEDLWPFDIPNLTIKPTEACYTSASLGSIQSASKFNTTNPSFVTQIKNALSLGLGVMIGIVVYPSMESEATAVTGIIPMPNEATEQPIGGHALPLEGYSDKYSGFFFRNSWGSDWGQRGNGVIPYAYLEKYCISAWMLSNKEVGVY